MKKITQASDKEVEFIEAKIDEYIQAIKPYTQEKTYVPFRYVIKQNREIVAGISAYSSMYKIGYIETLWVSEKCRRKGYGKELLKLIEKELKTYGCRLVHLETFDFQGIDFYKSQNYQVFGELFHEDTKIREYFLVKYL